MARYRGYVLTIPYFYNNERVKFRYIVDCLKCYDYFVFQLEKGADTGYKHYQLYLEHGDKISFSTLKRLFPYAHIEAREGSKKDAFEYCTKLDTRLHGYWEFGVRPSFDDTNTIIRSKKESMLLDIKEGLSDVQLLLKYPTIFSKKVVDEYRSILGVNLFTENRNVVCTYITGLTGVGKSFYIRHKYGNENVYVVNDYDRDPFGGYAGQDVIIFEEYRSNFSLSVFLQYLDVYPLMLPCRYSNRPALYTKVYVVSNWSFDMQYANLCIDDKKAFGRRFKYHLTVTRDFIFRKTYDNLHEKYVEDNCYNYLGPSYKALVTMCEEKGLDYDDIRTSFEDC